MAKWGVFVDPDTGAPMVDGGRVRCCSQALSQVAHCLLTELGTVDGATNYGAGITQVTHISDSTLRDLERRANKALSQLVGPIIDSFDREVTWNSDGYPQIEIAFTSPSGCESTTFRLGR